MKTGARPRQGTLPRRKPSLAARVKPFWIVWLVLLGLAGWGSAWLVQAPSFRVVRVGVDVPIASPVSRDRVRTAAAIAPGANVWLLNTRAIAQRVEAIPYVDVASIHRGQFPRPFVELTVTVRRPSACVRTADGDVTIDARARVLQTGCAAPVLARIDAGAAVVPGPGGTITGAALTRLLGDARTLADGNVAVRSLRHDRWGGLEAVDVTGVTLKFGDDGDLAKKAALVGPVRSGIGTKRPIRAIDLRAPGTPTVEFR